MHSLVLYLHHIIVQDFQALICIVLCHPHSAIHHLIYTRHYSALYCCYM